jgi:hypothetical protein
VTIAALRRLLEEEQPDIRRHPAPDIPHRTHRKETPVVDTPTTPPTTELLAPAATDIPELDALLAWAASHDDEDVRDQGARAYASLTALSQRRQADEELARITSEAEELEQRLAELRARETELRPAARKKPGKAKAERDHEPAVVRAWARQQGIECAPLGRVPKAIVDQWREAGQPRVLQIAS